MKLKLHWGTGITIAMVLMIIGMLILVFIATRQDFDLVEKDYYQKGINYQAQIERINNTNSLRDKPSILLDGTMLHIRFPGWFTNKNIEGNVAVYSPVNENYDKSFELKPDSSLAQLVSLKELPPGRYTVKLGWTANQTPYYLEQEIRIEP
ncbi:MAG: FixH family protein [Mangrovibacterium sp.]